MIQVMVGANGPVRGPHPVRASGKSVKDDSSPVRGPHPIRASEQEKEIQGGMVGKEESGADARCWRSQTSDPQASGSKSPTESFSQRIRYVARYAR